MSGKPTKMRKRHGSERKSISMTIDDAQSIARRGEDRTDWTRVNAMTEAEVDANAKADLDNPSWTKAMLAKAQIIDPRKQAVSIRLDTDILEFIKREGPGYQSRINAILRTYVEARKAG
jgi:uncharacterized protein (DUF4415 family)